MPKDGFNYCELRSTNKLFCKMCKEFNNCIRLEQEQMKRDREYEKREEKKSPDISKESILAIITKLTEQGNSTSDTTNYTRGSLISFDRGYLSALEDVVNSL